MLLPIHGDNMFICLVLSIAMYCDSPVIVNIYVGNVYIYMNEHVLGVYLFSQMTSLLPELSYNCTVHNAFLKIVFFCSIHVGYGLRMETSSVIKCGLELSVTV